MRSLSPRLTFNDSLSLPLSLLSLSFILSFSSLSFSFILSSSLSLSFFSFNVDFMTHLHTFTEAMKSFPSVDRKGWNLLFTTSPTEIIKDMVADDN